MSSTTNEALDLTLGTSGGSRRVPRTVTPLVRQFSVPDTSTHISVTELGGCRPLKIKERFALRYSMRSASMDAGALREAVAAAGVGVIGGREPHTPSPPGTSTLPLHPTPSGSPLHPLPAGGHSRSASATPRAVKPPLIRYAHSLPEVDSRQLMAVQEESEDHSKRAVKGKRKTLLLPSLSADETGLPSPTKKPSPGASPNLTSGGTFFQSSPLDLSNLRKIPPISQIEEEEAEQRKVYQQQLQKLRDSIPDGPLRWRREDVHNWLAYMRLSHRLPQIRYERFLMNGKALALMSQQMFLERVPCGGDLLYRNFQERFAADSASQLASHSVFPPSSQAASQAASHSALPSRSSALFLSASPVSSPTASPLAPSSAQPSASPSASHPASHTASHPAFHSSDASSRRRLRSGGHCLMSTSPSSSSSSPSLAAPWRRHNPCIGDIGRSVCHEELSRPTPVNKRSELSVTSLQGKGSITSTSCSVKGPELSVSIGSSVNTKYPGFDYKGSRNPFRLTRSSPSSGPPSASPSVATYPNASKLYPPPPNVQPRVQGVLSIPKVSSIASVPNSVEHFTSRIPVFQGIPRPVALSHSMSTSALPTYPLTIPQPHNTCSPRTSAAQNLNFSSTSSSSSSSTSKPMSSPLSPSSRCPEPEATSVQPATSTASSNSPEFDKSARSGIPETVGRGIGRGISLESGTSPSPSMAEAEAETEDMSCTADSPRVSGGSPAPNMDM